MFKLLLDILFLRTRRGMDEAAGGSAAQAVPGMGIKAAKVMTCVDELKSLK